MNALVILTVIIVLVLLGVYLYSRSHQVAGGIGEVKRSDTSTEANPRMGGLESNPASQFSEFRVPTGEGPSDVDDKNFQTRGRLDAFEE